MMATIATPVRGDQRVVFHDVAWETYVALLEARGEGVVRLTYHRGVLEIMTRSQLHERLSRFLNRFVVEITLDWAWSWRRWARPRCTLRSLIAAPRPTSRITSGMKRLSASAKSTIRRTILRPTWPSKSISRRALASTDLERFVNRRGTLGENALAAEFRQWVRQSRGAQ
jgi:hypothetical protein